MGMPLLLICANQDELERNAHSQYLNKTTGCTLGLFKLSLVKGGESHLAG